MKIRIYFPSFPFPITEGAHLVVADQIRYFAVKGHEVELVCWRESRASIERKLARSQWPSGAKWTLLEGGLETAAERLLRVTRSLTSEFSSPELVHYPPRLLEQVAHLDRVDLAIYHYSYAYLWLSQRDRLAPESRRVVHFHNVESELHVLRGGPFGWIHRRNARKMRPHETALAAHTDELWFLSSRDAKMLNIGNARVIPPTFDLALRARRRSLEVGQVLAGFIGGMNFKPNYESASWILRELAPRLAGSGFAGKLVFVGKEVPRDLYRLSKRYPFAEFKGFVENLDAFWAGLSFLLVPHIVGSGVRTKILESIVSGVPVLTNSAGAASLPAGARENKLLICQDDPTEWARILLQESRPQVTRMRLEPESTCNALTAEEVYAGVV